MDDEEVVRRIAHRFLSEEGYRVLEAKDLEELFYVLRASRVDLVLLDVVMPLDGVEVARRVYDSWPGQRILFMSAYGDPVIAEHGVAPWNQRVLDKPFARDELLAAVGEAIERRRKRRDRSTSPDKS